MIIASIYAVCLVLITLFGVGSPQNSLEWLVAASNNLDAARLTLAVLLMAGAFIPADAKAKQLLFGGLCLSLGLMLIGNFAYSGFFQQLGLQFYTLDMVALLEGVVITALLRAHAAVDEPEEIFDMFSGQGSAGSSAI